MFPVAWLNDNRIIGSMSAIVVSAYAIAGGLSGRT